MRRSRIIIASAPSAGTASAAPAAGRAAAPATVRTACAPVAGKTETILVNAYAPLASSPAPATTIPPAPSGGYGY
jgi:hypothetical protein